MPVKHMRKRPFVKDGGSSAAGVLLGYARVSKGDDQANALQTKALRSAPTVSRVVSHHLATASQYCLTMRLARNSVSVVLAAFAVLLSCKVAMTRPVPAPYCSGDLRCMAREAATGDCGGSDAEAVTSLAVLGSISDAFDAMNQASCSMEDKDRRMMMERATILGRLAVARKLSDSGDGHAAIDTAILLAHVARTPTTYLFGHVAAHDSSFEDVACDLARDLLVLGEVRSGKEMTEQIRGVPTDFVAICLGRLAGTLDRLNQPEEASELRHEALRRAAALTNRSAQQIALGVIAIGLQDAGHLTEALAMLRGSDLPGFEPDLYTGGIRLDFYRAMIMHEAISGNYDKAWDIAEADQMDNAGFAPWVDLAELLRSLITADMPTESKKIIDRAQTLLAKSSAEKVNPIFRAALASALITANEPEQARAQLAAVAHAAEAAPSADLRAYYLESLIRAYAEVGDFEQALNLMNRSFPATDAAFRKIDRWGALHDIALAAVRRGETAKAIQVAEFAHDEELRELVIRAIAIRAANHKQYVEAEHWARMMGSSRGIQAVLADIAARGAITYGGSAKWIVARRDEEKQRMFPGAFISAFDP